MLIQFHEMEPDPKSAPPPVTEAGRVAELEHELQATREYLQAAIEELEAANEELKSTNEEMQSANEELRELPGRAAIAQRGTGHAQLGTRAKDCPAHPGQQ